MAAAAGAGAPVGPAAPAYNPAKHWPGAWNGRGDRAARNARRNELITDMREAVAGEATDNARIDLLMNSLNAIEQSSDLIPDFAAAANTLRRRGGRRNRKSRRKNRKSHRKNRKSHRRNRKSQRR